MEEFPFLIVNFLQSLKFFSRFEMQEKYNSFDVDSFLESTYQLRLVLN